MCKIICTICLASLFCFAGCDLSDAGESSITKQEAHSVIEQAQAEFYEGVSSTVDADISKNVVTSEVSEMSEERLAIKEKIMGYAFEAYASGDSEKLVSYLKEVGLYEKYQNIVEKYDLETYQDVIAQPSATMLGNSVTTSFFDSFIDGDIFLCYGGEKSSKLIGFFIPGKWKHAGIMDKTNPWGGNSNYCVLSANSGTSHGFTVGYETRESWAEKSAVSAWRVEGRTDTTARSALDYGINYLGEPYSVFVSRDSDDEWYCSKVVYRCWLSQGKTLEDRGLVDFWVTPTDLGEDDDTYWIGGDQE